MDATRMLYVQKANTIKFSEQTMIQFTIDIEDNQWTFAAKNLPDAFKNNFKKIPSVLFDNVAVACKRVAERKQLRFTGLKLVTNVVADQNTYAVEVMKEEQEADRLQQQQQKQHPPKQHIQERQQVQFHS